MNGDRAPRIFVSSLSKGDTSVIALVAEEEFALAQEAIPEWRFYSSYEDWLDSREGYQMGLTFAGVNVRMAPIALSAFLLWCRERETPSSAAALQLFAELSCNHFLQRERSLPAAIGAVARLSR
jgi:hypothetical protein